MTLTTSSGSRLDGARREVAEIVSTVSVPVAVLAVVSATFGFVVFGHTDLAHTAGSSYAYLLGHWTDFYGYNQQFFVKNDYFPSIYLVFALWMAPVKLLVSPGAQNSWNLSSWEVLWGKLGLTLVFLGTVRLVLLVARELFPGRREIQRTVVATYLLSPFIAFVVGAFGQYDIVGVFFTLLGLLYYLRGDKWKFALCFAAAASFKYFALLVFAPLLVLAYKRLRDLVALSAVAMSVLVIEALAYLHDPVFRTTIWSLAASNLSGASGNDAIKPVAMLVMVLGLFLLWRTQPTPQTLGLLAVHAAALAYGILFLVVLWNLVWFVILAPLFALSVGYLRRPGRFLVWESLVFVAYIWNAVNQWPRNVDVDMVRMGALRSLFGPPHLVLGDLYFSSAVPAMRLLLTAYFVSPALFWVADRVERRRSPLGDPTPVSKATWAVRSVTALLVFTLPTLTAMWIPMGVAKAITPTAAAYGMTSVPLCASAEHATSYSVHDGQPVVESLVAADNGFSGLSIPVGTYGRTQEGSLAIDIRDDAGDLVGSADIDLATVADNAAVYALLDVPQATSQGRTYTVSFQTVGVATNLALWGSSDDCELSASLIVAGHEQRGDLNLSVYYPRP